LSAAELQISKNFSSSVPDYSRVGTPYVFSSMLCREQHFHLPLYTYWCKALGILIGVKHSGKFLDFIENNGNLYTYAKHSMSEDIYDQGYRALVLGLAKNH
jgi:hypothetical protein